MLEERTESEDRGNEVGIDTDGGPSDATVEGSADNRVPGNEDAVEILG